MSNSGEQKAPPPQTRKAALLVHYDGTTFSGLQRQQHTSNTIQEKIEESLAKIGGREPGFVACGRTDSGVHATGQVVTVYIPESIPDRKILPALNRYLPPEIRIVRAKTCHPEFNPRFDARMRTYIYRLTDRRDLPPTHRNFVTTIHHRLDPELTVAAARAFVGQWELDKWRSSICQGTRTLLNIDEADAFPPKAESGFSEEPVPYWRLLFRARSFLHHQVRFMTGAVVAVGSGRLPLEDLKSALSRGERPTIVKCEPPNGLCFTHVEFVKERDPFSSDETHESQVESELANDPE